MEQGLPTIQNRYRQYKVGIAKILNWLVTTAQASRDVSGILPSLRELNTAAKQATQRSQTNQTAPAKIAVSTAQMLQLAEIIVATSASVPEDIMRTTKAVIAGRQLCSDWYAALGNATDRTVAEQTGKHRYFMGILQRIQSLLERAKSSKRPTRPTTSQHDLGSKRSAECEKPNESLSNMFAALEVETPGTDALSYTSSTENTRATVTFELSDDEGTTTFALWCVVQEMYDIRAEVRSVWERYTNGDLSLNVAGFVVDETTALLHDAEIDLDPEANRSWSWTGVISHFNLTIEIVNPQIFIRPKTEKIHRTFLKQGTSPHELAEMFCPRAFVLLFSFRIAIQNLRLLGQEAILSNEVYKCLPNIHPFGSVLQLVLPEFAAMSRLPLGNRCFPGGIISALQFAADRPDHSPLMSHVVALQAMMDFFEILGDEYHTAVAQFKERVLHDRRRFMKHKERLPSLQVMAQGQDIRDPYYNLIDEASTDGFYKSLRLQAMDEQGHAPRARAPYQIHSRFPSLAGRATHISMLALQFIGHLACNHDLIVLSLAYLYKAAQKVGAVVRTWEDMEYVISAQSTERDFVLEPVEGLPGLPKCFGRSLGMSLSEFRGGRRPLPPDGETVMQSRAGRQIRHLCPIYNNIEQSMDTGQNNISSNYSTTLLPSPSVLRKAAPQSTRLDSAFKQYERTGKLTSAQLMFCMEEILSNNDEDLHFEYLEFAVSCQNLIQDIRHSLTAKLRTILEDCPLLDSGAASLLSGPFYHLAYTILWDAVDSMSSEASCKESMLFRVAGVMDAHIKKEGAACSTSMREMKASLRRAPQKHAQTDSISSIDPAYVMFIMQVIGLPTANEERVGCFCSSKEEAESRSRIAEAWYCPDSVQKVTSAQELNAQLNKIVQVNLQRMSTEQKQQLQLKLARCIGEDDHEAWEEVKKFLALANLTPEKLFDILLTHSGNSGNDSHHN